MTLEEQVFARASRMAGALTERKTELLRTVCAAVCGALAARLRQGVEPEDCADAFVTAASLYALAALEGVREGAAVEEFRAGDLTVRTGSGGSSGAGECLRGQAGALMRPYLQDCFSFTGV